MKKIALTISLLALAACVSKEGLTEESARYPLGNPRSGTVVEEFGDLQCPACRGAQDKIVKPLLERYGNAIRFEFVHFPLRQIHAYAQEAGEAAECAADQGKFWEFVDATYEDQGALARKDLIERAEEIGVADITLFTRCVKSRIKRNAVQAGFDDGRKRSVNATPTFFVGGVRVPRNTLDAITGMIEEQTQGQRL